MRDITDLEVSQLPLPENWTKFIRVHSKTRYKNVVSGIETDEHPYMQEALNAARRRKLPPGWSVKEAMLDDGSYDYYYSNPELGVSLWDPPFLRQCLADILGANGHSSVALWILSETGAAPEEGGNSVPVPQVTIESDAPVEKDIAVSDISERSQLDEIPTRVPLAVTSSQTQFVSPSASAGPEIDINISDYNEVWEAKAERESIYKLSPNGTNNSSSEEYLTGNVNSIQTSLPWASPLFSPTQDIMRSPNNNHIDNSAALVQSYKHSKPPKTTLGVKILMKDCAHANLRAHELLVRLRTSLCEQSNVSSRVIDPFLDILNSNSNNNSNSDSPDDGRYAAEGAGEYTEKRLLQQAADILSRL